MINEPREKTILIVDDSSLIRNQVAGLLEGFGYRVLTAPNGEEGLKILQEKGYVDLVIMDVVMPVMDGRAMLREIRSREEIEDLPVLVLTGADHINMLSECAMAGCNDYLIKPVDPRLLYQRVQALIETFPRAYRRVACNLLVEVDSGTEQHVGEIVEISEGGLRISLESPLAVNDIVKLTFDLPGSPDPVVVGGKVVYCLEGENGFQTGLSLVIVHPETMVRLTGFLGLRSS